MMAAGKCFQKSFMAFMEKGKIPLNVYDLAQSGGKKDLTKMDEAEKKRAYRTAGYVFLGFGLALIFSAGRVCGGDFWKTGRNLVYPGDRRGNCGIYSDCMGN